MNFRRCITALALLTLFAGLAAAQNYGSAGGAMTCSTVAAVTPQVRAEGVTELVGDIIITCQGGNASPSYSVPIPQGDIVVSLNQIVTSRLATGGTTNPGANGTPSEALLLIDEPNSGIAAPVPNYGPAAPLTLCTSATGCGEYPTLVNTAAGNYIVATANQHPSSSSNPYTGVDPGPNVFQGNVLGNLISFQGIPFLPPVTTGIVRVYRITNIRVNPLSQVGPITATISTNGQSTLAVANPTVTLGYSALSINPTVDTRFATNVCASPSSFQIATLHFKELIPNAFKTRVAPVSTSAFGAYPSYGVALAQNIPGQLYSSESGFIFPATGVQAGLADFGTRFKATFANIPAGVTISVSPINTNASGTAGAFANPEPMYAQLISVTPSTNGIAPGETIAYNNGISSGTITSTNNTAVWEVVSTNTTALEDFQFAVYITYSANVPAVINTTGVTSVLPTGTALPSVTLAYAPTSTNPYASVGANTAATAIPRFQVGNGNLNGIIEIDYCQTILLFPYVTDNYGFDTGFAISNTSADPLGTLTTTGYCTLNFYGANAPTAPPQTPVIAPGTEWANNVSFYVPQSASNTGFAGYMFATCNFQFAHGFAFVSDYGARNIAMGYLALIVNNGATSAATTRGKTVAGEALNN